MSEFYQARLHRLVRWNQWTLVVVLLLILAGGIVRSSGSGMGCPDWPLCFGQVIPPLVESDLPSNYQEIYAERGYADTRFNALKTWTEYLNRLLGALTGLMVLVQAVLAFLLVRSRSVSMAASTSSGAAAEGVSSGSGVSGSTAFCGRLAGPRFGFGPGRYRGLGGGQPSSRIGRDPASGPCLGFDGGPSRFGGAPERSSSPGLVHTPCRGLGHGAFGCFCCWFNCFWGPGCAKRWMPGRRFMQRMFLRCGYWARCIWPTKICGC